MGERPSGRADRVLRAAVVALAGAGALLLVRHRSDDPDLWGRYALPFACLLLAYVPLLGAAAWFAARGGAVTSAGRALARSRLLLVLGLALAVPLLATLVPYVSGHDPIDGYRAAAVAFGTAAFALAAWGAAGRSGRSGLETWLRNVALAGATFVVLVVALSAVIAVRKREIPDRVTPDEVREVAEAWRTPGAAFVYTGQPGRPREFAHEVKNNALGFNDRERSFESRSDRRRIVVLGDSYVEALHVPAGRSFAALLERRLNAEEDRYEVIPLGRGDTGQAEALRNFETFGVHFDPDVVILLFVGNDLYDNDPDLRRAYVRFERKWSSAPREPRALLFPALGADRWITARLHALLARHGHRIDPTLARATIRPDHLAFVSLEDPSIARSLERTRALLDEIVKRTGERGIDLILAARPETLTHERFVRDHPAFRTAEVDVRRLSHWIESYAASRGARFVDLHRAFHEHLERGGDRFTWRHDGHWNEIGHGIAADAFHRALRAR